MKRYQLVLQLLSDRARDVRTDPPRVLGALALESTGRVSRVRQSHHNKRGREQRIEQSGIREEFRRERRYAMRERRYQQLQG